MSYLIHPTALPPANAPPRAARPIRLLAPLLAVSLLAACSGGNDGDPGSVTADEAAQLNDAAAMLDANSIDLDATTANDTDTAL